MESSSKLPWQTEMPVTPGNWLLRCAEAPSPELVRVFARDDGTLMAEDPHLGVLGLHVLHEGLSTPEWSLKPEIVEKQP